MATTSRQILNGAYGKSKKNQPTQIATEATELLEVVHRALTGIYSFAARLNPTYFGATIQRSYVSPGWFRPAEAEAIWRIEQDSDDKECIVVPFDDRSIYGATQPAVYHWGQVFRTAVTLPTVGEKLNFWYAKRPTKPAGLDNALDSLWVDDFNELLILEVAIYLSLKDNRPETEQLIAERDRWATLFAGHLEHETIAERRRFDHVKAFQSQALVPVRALLAGGNAFGSS